MWGREGRGERKRYTELLAILISGAIILQATAHFLT